MKTSNSESVLQEILDHCEEHLEMIPDIATRLRMIIRILATLVASERSTNDFLSKRLKEIELRIEKCSRTQMNG